MLQGIDFEARYRHRVGAGSLTWRLLGTKVDENSLLFPGAPKDRFEREQPDLRLLATVAYASGPFSATLTERYLDSHLLNRNFVEGVNVDENDVASWAITDLSGSYALPFAGQSVSVFATVSNVFDRGPPQTPGALGFVGGTFGPAQNAPNAGLYDILGRRWVVGLNVKF